MYNSSSVRVSSVQGIQVVGSIIQEARDANLHNAQLLRSGLFNILEVLGNSYTSHLYHPLRHW